MIKLLLDKYIFLTEYCDNWNFDPGWFRIHHEEYAGRYKKLDYAQQGELCHLINEYFDARKANTPP
jgi:hypothetical protein